MQTLENFLLYTKMQKARNRWRLLAIILLIIFAVGYLSNQENPKNLTGESPHIARISLEGMILEGEEQTKRLKNISKNPNIKGVIVEIDSPGGTMTGGVSVYENLLNIGQNKPVVAVMKTVAASGGYMAALGADHIIAGEATLTGSIGVLMPLIDATELANKIGIKSDNFASGKLKANTSPIETRGPEDRAYLMELVNELNQTFYKYVETRRPSMSPDQIDKMRDGRAVVGTQAIKLNLVDALGNTDDAKAWLIQKAELDAGIPVKDYKLDKSEHWLQEALLGMLPSNLQSMLRVQSMPSPAMWAVLQ